MERVKWFVKYARHRSVLDLGCAGDPRGYDRENWLHKHLAAAAKECSGLDMNEEAVSHLALKGYKNIMVGDAQNFSFDRTFEVVVAGELIEHLDDLKGFFTGVRSVLQDDGYLLISTPNPWCWLSFVLEIHKEHVSWFCPITLSELLRRYKFAVEEIILGADNPVYYKIFFIPKIFRFPNIFCAARKLPD